MMVALGIVELAALLIGFSLTERAGGLLVGHFGLDHADSDADIGAVGQCLAWLHVGRVPMLVVLTLILLGFSVGGLSLQYVVHACFGVMLSPSVAAVIAMPGALIITRHFGGLIGKYVPAVQSSALSEAEFVGSVAQIVTGIASKGMPTQARLVDRYGQPHYVRVEPRNEGMSLAKGMKVVLVEQISESLYFAVAL